jgi:hypothetical protein
MGKKFTDLEIDFLKEEYKNYTNEELAYGLGRGRGSINWRLLKLGLKMTKEEKRKLVLTKIDTIPIECIIKDCPYPELEQKIEAEHSHGLGKCWICISHYLTKDGYPMITRDGKCLYMNRFIYKQMYGKIPKGKWILHQCDTPQCINPYHLYAGTPQDNMNDKMKRGRDKCLIPVLKIDRYTGKILEEFPSIREAEKKTGVANQSISKCCKGKLKSAGGFAWRYKNAISVQNLW